MAEIAFNVSAWSAWAPGLEQAEDWQAWSGTELPGCDGAPKLPEVPAMQRRRMSRLSKMAIQCATRCVEDSSQVATVFCSRHGEVNRTDAIIDNILAGEQPSPTAFSLSVHNTSSGLFHINFKNQQASTAIAAGADTFQHGLIEAAAQLHAGRESVLLICYDEPLPQWLGQFESEDAFPFGLGLLLTPASAEGTNIRMQWQASSQAGETQTLPAAIQFLRFLITDTPSLSLHSERLSWEWQRD